MKLALVFAVLLAPAAFPAVATACGDWERLPYRAIGELEVCDEPPVQRRLGDLCVRHEWLCGRGTFERWFERWMAEVDEPIRLEAKMDQLIFSGESQQTAWALFWSKNDESKRNFVVLFSRLRMPRTLEKDQ